MLFPNTFLRPKFILILEGMNEVKNVLQNLDFEMSLKILNGLV